MRLMMMMMLIRRIDDEEDALSVCWNERHKSRERSHFEYCRFVDTWYSSVSSQFVDFYGDGSPLRLGARMSVV